VKRQVTGDLTLQGAIELAIQQNPEIMNQLQEIERTRGLVIIARSDALPHLSVNSAYDQQSKSLLESVGSGGFVKSGGGVGELLVPLQNGQVINLGELLAAASNPNTNRAIPDKTWQVTFQVTQSLYAGGAIRANIAAAKFGEDTSYWQLRDVIDRVVATVRTGSYCQALAVNTATNKIYVANNFGHSVTVIDGLTHETTTIRVGQGPRAIVVNQVTNKIYTANYGSKDATEIDGASNNATSIPTGNSRRKARRSTLPSSIVRCSPWRGCLIVRRCSNPCAATSR